MTFKEKRELLEEVEIAVNKRIIKEGAQFSPHFIIVETFNEVITRLEKEKRVWK